MATAGQVISLADGKVSPQAQIGSYIVARKTAREALDALNREIPPEAAKLKKDFAKQAVAQQAGKPNGETGFLVGLHKSVKTKLDQLQEKKCALEAWLEGLMELLEELKQSAPADYICALDLQIVTQEQLATGTQTDALRAQEVLKDLMAEKQAILQASPGAAWATTPWPRTATAAASPLTTAEPGAAAVSTKIRRGSRKKNGRRGRK